MAKSKGRLLAELLASDGKIKESKSALDISGGKLAPSDIPILPNSKLENSSISIAGHSTSLGESVSLNTGDITEHTNFKYYTDTRVRSAISASGDIAYNSTTGVISFSQAAGAVISVNGTTGSVVLDTGDIAENGNLYHTTARARGAISATGSLSYNSTTGVISFTMPAQNTSNITEGTNKYYTDARADARIVNAGSANWNTAYGWGNHASAGYLTSYTETDTLATVTARGATTSTSIKSTAGGRAVWASATDGFMQVGPTGGGASGVFGAHRETTGGSLDYTTYIGYDVYYDDGNKKWYANRTNLGRKWKVNFGGYHQNKFTISTYDGGGTSGSSLSAGWLEADWYERFSVDASGVNGVKVAGNIVWNAGNDGSGSGLDADLLDGLQLHTGRNNEANKVVRTQANGYIDAGWINTTSGARTTQAITRVYASDDAYIRYYTLANFGDQIASHINYNSLENKPTITTLSNGANNRIVTAQGVSSINAEANLQYDGSALDIYTAGNAVTDNHVGLTFRLTGTYSDGRYEHRFRKRDEGGGIPLYIDKTGSTANFHTAIARFGSYTSNTEEFEVYGAAKVSGALSVTGAISGTTATASGGTNTTALANTAFVQQEITSLIGGAPGTLDTLNELAAAINDDSNYNSTLTTALATKLPKAGGTMTGALGISDSLLISYSGNDGGGRDAGLKIQNDGSDWGVYIRKASAAQYGMRIDSAGSVALAIYGSEGGSDLNFAVDGSSGNVLSTGDIGMATGHSSGKFAVMATSVHGSYDFYNNGTSYFNGNVIVDANLTLSGGGQILGSPNITAGRVVTSGLYGTGHSSSTLPIWQYNAGNPGYGIAYTESSPDVLRFDVSGNLMSGTADLELRPDQLKVNGNTVYHVGNDGSGTGLDADLLDGYQGNNYIGKNGSGYYQPNSWIDFNTTGDGLYWSGGTGAGWHIYPQSSEDLRLRSGSSGSVGLSLETQGTKRGYVYANSSNQIGFLNQNRDWRFKVPSSGSVYRDSHVVWDAGNDGSGSGLDADTVDGVHASAFIQQNTGNLIDLFANQNGTNELRLDNNRQDLGNVPVSKVSGRNSVEVANMTFYRGTGGNSGFIRFQNKPTNAASLTDVFQVGDGATVGYGVDILAGGLRIGGNEVINSSRVMTIPQIKLGDGNDGYFYSDINGRTAFRSGDFYIQDTVTSFYNYATNQYYGDNSGDNIHFRGNVLDGTGWSINGAGKFSTRDIQPEAGYHFQRSDHHSGHLEGSYNNVGANESKSNPIYSIGSAYNPSSTTLGNMYGIGFSYSNASFLSFSGGAGWGMYVASDGDARVWLNGSAGTIASTGQHYVGSNVVWNAGNDGSGSGLDADLLDGWHRDNITHAEASQTWSSIAASSTQAKRYHIARLYGCPAHWDSDWQNIELHVTAESYEAGTLKYKIHGNYGGAGSQASMIQMHLTEAYGDMIPRFRIILGSPVDAGWDHSGADTYYVDVFAEASHYSNWKIDAKTFGHGVLSSNPSSGGAKTVFYSSPAASNISTFAETHTQSTIRLDTSNIQTQKAQTKLKAHSNGWEGGLALISQDGSDTFQMHPDNNGYMYADKTWYFTAAPHVGSIGSPLWHPGNDGSGSGLDADTVDGIHAASFLRSDAADTATGLINFNNRVNIANSVARPAALNSDSVAQARIGGSDVYLYVASLNSTGGYAVALQAARSSDFASFNLNLQSNGGGLQRAGNTVWDAGNDGSGSGLDADLLDGYQGNNYIGKNGSGYYQPNSWIDFNTTNEGLYWSGGTSAGHHIYPDGTTYMRFRSGAATSVGLRLQNSSATTYGSVYANSSNYIGFLDNSANWALQVRNNGTIYRGNGTGLIWDSANDGSGSGLDADNLDGETWDSQNKSVAARNWTTEAGDGQGLTFWGGTGTALAGSYAIAMSSQGNGNAGRHSLDSSSDYNMYFKMSGGTDRGFVFKNSGTNVAAITKSGRFLGSAVYLDGSSSQNQYVAADSTHSLTIRNMGNTAYGGLVLQGSDGTHGLQLYFDGSGANYGFLDAAWGAWDIQKIRNGTFKVDEGSGLKRVLNEANWSSYITLPTDADTIDGRGFVNTGSNSAQNSDTINSNGISYYTSGVTNFSGNATDGALYSQQYSSSWQHQIAGDYRSGQIALRGKNNGTWQAWRKVWDESNDGSGSGLDADTLDGVQGASFLRSDTDDTATGQYTFSKVNDHAIRVGTIRGTVVSGQSGEYIQMYERVHIGSPSGWGSRGAPSYGLSTYGGANLATDTGSVTISGSTAWHAGNDGSGSGLDADLLDGKHLSQVARFQSSSDFANGTLVTTDIASSGTNGDSFVIEVTGKAYGSSRPHSVIAEGYLYNNTIINTNGTNISGSNFTYLKVMSNGGYLSFWWPRHGYWNSYDVHVRSSSGGTANYNRVTAIANSVDPSGASKKIQINLATSWTSANDGSGSGLDADLLDGVQGANYARLDQSNVFGAGSHSNYFRRNNTSNYTDAPLLVESYGGSSTTTGVGFHISGSVGRYLFMNNSADLFWNSTASKIWHASNDGSGSGLDADLLDGQQGSYYYAASNPSGYITASGNAATSHAVTGSAFGTTSSPSSVLEYQQASGQTDTRLAPSGDWHNSIRMGHGNPYNYYSNTIAARMTGTGPGDLYTQSIYNNAAGGWRKLWSTGNDGAGSGLDADTVDGIQGASFIRGDSSTTFVNNNVTFQKGEFTTGTSGQNNSRQAGELSYSYGYQFGGAWTSPFPDLVLGYHTGVRIGGYYGYGGTRFYNDHPSRTTTIIFSVANGDAHVRATNNIYAYTSDIRLKENFRPIENAVDKVKAIGGFIFDWRKDMMEKHDFTPDQQQDDAGLIAQEVQKVMPAAIKRAPFDHDLTKPNQSKSGEDFLTVQYEKMVPLLVEAIKEQQKQIDKQQKQINELNEKLENK